MQQYENQFPGLKADLHLLEESHLLWTERMNLVLSATELSEKTKFLYDRIFRENKSIGNRSVVELRESINGQIAQVVAICRQWNGKPILDEPSCNVRNALNLVVPYLESSAAISQTLLEAAANKDAARYPVCLIGGEANRMFWSLLQPEQPFIFEESMEFTSDDWTQVMPALNEVYTDSTGLYSEFIAGKLKQPRLVERMKKSLYRFQESYDFETAMEVYCFKAYGRPDQTKASCIYGMLLLYAGIVLYEADRYDDQRYGLFLKNGAEHFCRIRNRYLMS